MTLKLLKFSFSFNLNYCSFWLKFLERPFTRFRLEMTRFHLELAPFKFETTRNKFFVLSITVNLWFGMPSYKSPSFRKLTENITHFTLPVFTFLVVLGLEFRELCFFLFQSFIQGADLTKDKKQNNFLISWNLVTFHF